MKKELAASRARAHNIPYFRDLVDLNVVELDQVMKRIRSYQKNKIRQKEELSLVEKMK